MQILTLLMGVLPLLAFVIADSFFGMKAGLVLAIILAIAETVFSLVYFGELDSVTLASMVLVCLMAIVAFKENSRTVFLFQPVILSTGLGLFLIISYLFGHPVFLEMAIKYKQVLPENTRDMVSQVYFQKVFKSLSLTAGVACLVHAGLTAFAALRLNKWWWIFCRGVVGYILIFVAYLFSIMIVSQQ